MEVIKIGEHTYTVDPKAVITANDHFVFNNPHPDSTMKNKVMKCSTIMDDHVVPVNEDRTFVLRQFPRTMCKLIIDTDEPVLKDKLLKK